MVGTDRLFGPLDPAADAGYPDAPPRMGFFTDTSVCIGCKACEVACKEWNGVPEDGLNLLGMSFDNTGALTANSWRHVAFIEQQAPTAVRAPGGDGVRWLMSSDVCKHCTHAACLDVGPTGALFPPSSARWWCRPRSATAAAAASRPAPTGSSTSAKVTAGHGNARCATTASATV
jgi:formate dehydrogenase iron-sulfur subunit